ncbi:MULTISPECIES: T9SS type A sorting domain-containing protein [Niastella]|uniref:T9SS type A sorting domain-containing protein n=1 Tax=Niastella soli TaxID=2821487 RepID=A0ABS3YVF9_9BACT|nr:T9SS type A sorting domain-containing protein [Niastella soli]MBO9201917.1 T9SS type A sorting domain-containing protein [Niastella soli]
MKKFSLLLFSLSTITICNAQVKFDWVKRATSTGQLVPGNIAVDATGNVYQAGSFVTDADFDPGSGTAQFISTGGSSDIFITKRNAAGDLLWVKTIGGADTEEATGLGLDASGNVYVIGDFTGTVNFDPGSTNSTLSTAVNMYNIYVLKLDASGNFVWVKGMTGNMNALPNDMAVDAAGNVHATGRFTGTVDFDPGIGEQKLTATAQDIFIFKIDASGNYVWAQSITSTNTPGNEGMGITVDATGNVYTTGEFTSDADFNPGPGTDILTRTGTIDCYILKLDGSGNYVWAKKLGGINSRMSPIDIAVDAFGAVYSTGSFKGTVDFDPDNTGTQPLSAATNAEDIYISKLDASGNYVWAIKLDENDTGYPYAIKVDAAGDVYTAGYFSGTIDVDPSATVHSLTDNNGNGDGYLLKLTSTGDYVWANNFGGSDYDAGVGLAVTAPDNVYLLGTFIGTVNFDPGTGTQDLTADNDDTYILHLTPSGTLPLTLLQFEAVDNNTSVLLQWQTTREQSMRGFEIERSADGKQFETIGSVAVKNSYNMLNNYAFTDAHPINGKCFYRLKMLELEAPATYSRIIPLRRQGNVQALQVSPNPATNVLYVQIDAHEAITLQIADVNGRIMFQQNRNLNGNTTFSLSVQSLPAGSYYLILKGKTTQKTQQFLKQ